MNTRPCYELLATDIRDMGVERVFGLMSDDTARFVATLDATGVKFHSARHENNVCAMAEGYASASGKLGIAVIGRGPAAANALHGATYAKRTGSRVLLIFGEAPLAAAPGRAIGPDGKAFESAAVLRAAGIRVYCPSDAAHARQLLQDAAAATLREGTVALLLPVDVQLQAVDADATRPQQREAAQQNPIAPRAAAIDTAAALLLRARKPLVLAGQGAWRSGARDALIALADHTGAALATTLKARGLFNGHPFNCGVMGSFSHAAGRRLIEQADLVLSFGAGLNDRTTSQGHALPAGVPIVQVDTQPAALGRWQPADVAILADARLAADALREKLPRRAETEMPLRDPQLQTLLARYRPESEFHDQPMHTPRTVDPRVLAIALDRMLPRDRNTVYDSGNFMQVIQYLDVTGPDRMKHTADFSSIGMGFGTAMGYALGAPQRPTVLFLGDGSLLMTLGELETVVREDIPLVMVAMNDCAYGAELHYLKRLDLPVAMSVFPDVDFAPVAQAFGFEAATIRTMADLEKMAAVLANPQGPVFLDCKINAAIASPSSSEKK
jgi:acetolactate synthase I/II/III large subunit